MLASFAGVAPHQRGQTRVAHGERATLGPAGDGAQRGINLIDAASRPVRQLDDEGFGIGQHLTDHPDRHALQGGIGQRAFDVEPLCPCFFFSEEDAGAGDRPVDVISCYPVRLQVAARCRCLAMGRSGPANGLPVTMRHEIEALAAGGRPVVRRLQDSVIDYISQALNAG
ncbi:hypothetical protein D3C84_899090 [compost metagenome]